MPDSKDRLQRKSILAYLDRKIAEHQSAPVEKALWQVRQWVQRWRPRANKRKGGLGK